jgi:hypothetical protein
MATHRMSRSTIIISFNKFCDRLIKIYIECIAQGFDAGYLIGQATVDNYNNLMVSLLGSEWWEPLVAELLNLFLYEQWTDYLSVQVPEEYKQELDGMTAGGHKAGNLF